MTRRSLCVNEFHEHLGYYTPCTIHDARCYHKDVQPGRLTIIAVSCRALTSDHNKCTPARKTPRNRQRLLQLEQTGASQVTPLACMHRASKTIYGPFKIQNTPGANFKSRCHSRRNPRPSRCPATHQEPYQHITETHLAPKQYQYQH